MRMAATMPVRAAGEVRYRARAGGVVEGSGSGSCGYRSNHNSSRAVMLSNGRSASGEVCVLAVSRRERLGFSWFTETDVPLCSLAVKRPRVSMPSPRERACRSGFTPVFQGGSFSFTWRGFGPAFFLQHGPTVEQTSTVATYNPMGRSTHQVMRSTLDWARTCCAEWRAAHDEAMPALARW